MEQQNILQPLSPITFYFDMDGVMAEYDQSLYVASHEGETPPFLIPKSHIFLHLKANGTIMAVFNYLYNKYRYDPTVNFKVLTSIPVGLCQAEHTIDKFTWSKGMVENFDIDDFYCVSVPKHHAVSESLWTLTANDILLDDYNLNLDNWDKHGGTALKCINHINSINPKYDYIDIDWSIGDIVIKIEDIIKQRKELMMSA